MNRRGYTLVEMLIALVLVVTLMSAAWGLTSLYNRFLTAGRDQALDQQIARSLFQLIEDDISLVTLPVRLRQSRSSESAVDDPDNDQAASPETFSLMRPSFFESPDSVAGDSVNGNSGSGGAESTGGDFGVFSGFMNELADQNLNLPPLEFIGSATELRMTVISPVDSRPTRAVTGSWQSSMAVPDQSLSAPAGMTGDQTDLLPDITRLVTVIYQFDAPGMTTDVDRQLPAGLHRIEVPTLQLRQLTSNSRFEQTESSDRQANNPQRRQRTGSNEIDRFTLQALLTPVADGEEPSVGQIEAVPEPRHEHIAEVVHFELEYFDGATWLSSWSSADALPAAIRIRFGVVSQDELTTIAGVYADAAVEQQPTTASTPTGFVDSLLKVKPRRFERILVLSSEGPPEFAPFGDDVFDGGAP